MLQATTPMESVLSTVASADFSHPLVLVLGRRGDARLQQVFVCVEGRAVPVQHGGIVNGVYRMLQVYYMLDMAYADAAKHILHFLQRSILNIEDQLPMARSVSDLSMYLRKNPRRGD
jgi:hypothetical protein